MGVDPATINVKDVCPDKQLPEWIGQFQKGEWSMLVLVTPAWGKQLLSVETKRLLQTQTSDLVNARN